MNLRRFLGATLVGLGGLLCAACSSSPSTSGCAASSTRIDHAAQLDLRDQSGSAVAAKYAQDISSFSVGMTKNYVFVIKNIANATTAKPLTIKGVSIQETGTGDKAVDSPAYTCLGPGNLPCDKVSWPQIIPVGYDAACAASGAQTSTLLTIRLTNPADGQLRNAKVSIVLEGDPTLLGQPKVLLFSTTAGVPKLDCQTPVDFGHMAIGESKTATLKCLNSGTAAADVSKVELQTKGMPLKLEFGGASVTPASPYAGTPAVSVAAGSSLEIKATLGPLSTDDMQSATMELSSNDLSKPIISTKFIVNSGACLTIDPTELDFGTVGVGLPSSKPIKLVSCGTSAVTISNIGVDSGGSQAFTVDCSAGSCFKDGLCPTAADPLKIEALAAPCTFLAVYTPSKVGDAATGQLNIDSDAGTQKHVALTGKGGQAAAPTPCATVTLNGQAVPDGGTVVPQSVLTFNAACSKAAAGQVVSKYKWAVTKQPAGNYTIFSPSPQAKLATYQPNVTGEYQFSLDIADDVGTAGSKTLIFNLTVISDDKLHVELTWATPGDPDQYDQNLKDAKGNVIKHNGTDLDLHLAHPDAVSQPGQKDLDGNGEADPWFAVCHDCYVLNKTPEWGDLQDPDDNAHLDLDDQDGWGPENASILTPEPGFLYHIGVFNWDENGDWGFGPSTPRVRVYINKLLTLDKTGPAMVAYDMWCVGRVSQDPPQVLPCKNAPSQGNILTHKYPYKLPADGIFGCK